MPSKRAEFLRTRHIPNMEMNGFPVLCVFFACNQDLRNGALNRPDLAERYLKVERESGFLFREKRSLQEILYPRTDEDDLFAWAEKAAV